ncbi:hypothetical protein LguiA_035978 [Lonicera macranthoides]
MGSVSIVEESNLKESEAQSLLARDRSPRREMGKIPGVMGHLPSFLPPGAPKAIVIFSFSYLAFLQSGIVIELVESGIVSRKWWTEAIVEIKSECSGEATQLGRSRSGRLA